MITEAIVQAALDTFKSESRKWAVRHYGDRWALMKTVEAIDLSAAGAAVATDMNFDTFHTQELAELALREKIIRAVLVAVDRVYMGVKPDA